MTSQDPNPSEEVLLALPQGEDPGLAWTNILLRTIGMQGFGISIGGGSRRIPEWEYADPTNPDDPYRYRTTEPDLRWVSLDYYVGWWKRGKEWYPALDDWIDAKSYVQAFHRSDVALVEAYRERHTRGANRYINLARKSIIEAPGHLGGIRRDHAHLMEFNRTSKVPFVTSMKIRYGIDLNPDSLPDLNTAPLHIPEHRGMKQLAILLDKMGRSDEAIEVCRQAIQIGWPGDWDVRLSRYTKRVERQANAPNQKPSRAKRSIAKFCTQCGEPLEAVDLFCGSCGVKRK